MLPEEFRARYNGEMAIHIPGGPGKFKDLFDWTATNTILNNSPFPHPDTKLVRDGAKVVADDEIEFNKEVQMGATIIIERVHHYDSNVGQFVDGLSLDLGEQVQTNLYMSPASNKGFKVHYDTHSVFIMQIEGSKWWKIFQPTIDYPLWQQRSHGKTPPSEAPYLELQLRAGDVLYIPRGHWHEAAAGDEPSLHLTIGIMAKTRLGFLLWLADTLREDPQWRKDMPLTFPHERDSTNSRLVEDVEACRDLLIEKFADIGPLIEDYLREKAAKRPKSRPYAFPATIEERRADQGATFRRDRFQQVHIRMTPEGLIEVALWKRLLTFEARAEALVRFIFSASSFSASDLMQHSPDLGWSEIGPVLEGLVKEGIVEMVDRPAPVGRYAAFTNLAD
jgi:ribosomal protein L16 Arg81 hydroxylase